MSFGEWPSPESTENKISGSEAEITKPEQMISALKETVEETQEGPNLTKEQQAANLRILQARQFLHKAPLRKSKLK